MRGKKRQIKLTTTQREELGQGHRRGRKATFRERCHYLLLSSQGYDAQAMASIYWPAQRGQHWEKLGLPCPQPSSKPIEILCRRMKYHWLKPAGYLSKEKPETALTGILSRFGTKYVINFSMNYKLSK